MTILWALLEPSASRAQGALLEPSASSVSRARVRCGRRKCVPACHAVE